MILLAHDSLLAKSRLRDRQGIEVLNNVCLVVYQRLSILFEALVGKVAGGCVLWWLACLGA